MKVTKRYAVQLFTADGRQKAWRGHQEETKWKNGGKWKNLNQKRVWKFPWVAVRWQRDGRLNATCESCFPSFLFGADGCLTIGRELTRCSLFLLNRYTLFLQNITCFMAPRFPCSGGMMSSAQPRNRRAIIFCSHLQKRRKKIKTNQAVMKHLYKRAAGSTPACLGALTEHLWINKTGRTDADSRRSWWSSTGKMARSRYCLTSHAVPFMGSPVTCTHNTQFIWILWLRIHRYDTGSVLQSERGVLTRSGWH